MKLQNNMGNKNEMCDCGHRYHGDQRNHYGDEYICKHTHGVQGCKQFQSDGALIAQSRANKRKYSKIAVFFFFLFGLLVIIGDLIFNHHG